MICQSLLQLAIPWQFCLYIIFCLIFLSPSWYCDIQYIQCKFTFDKHESAISSWLLFIMSMSTLVPLLLALLGSAPFSKSNCRATGLFSMDAWNNSVKSASLQRCTALGAYGRRFDKSCTLRWHQRPFKMQSNWLQSNYVGRYSHRVCDLRCFKMASFL